MSNNTNNNAGFLSLERAFQVQIQLNTELLSSEFTSSNTSDPNRKRSDHRKPKFNQLQFIQALSNTQTEIFTSPFINNLDNLDTIDSNENGILYLFIISALFEAYLNLSLPIQLLFPKLMNYIKSVSSQTLQYAPVQTLKLAQLLFRMGENFKMCTVVRPLILLTEKFTKPKSISCLHPITLKACLLSNHFKAAIRVLNFPITVAQQPITCEDILLYMYYGGLIYTGMKNFKMAQLFFGFNLTLPSAIVSKIQVESFKRLTLISLIKDGSLPPWVTKSLCTSQGSASILLWRTLKSLCSEYIQYAEAYTTLNSTKLQLAFQTHQPIFVKDQLIGLAKQTLTHVHTLTLQRLHQTHLALTLEDLGRQWQSSFHETEAPVVKAILSNQVHARICAEHNLVQFIEDPLPFSSLTLTQTLNQKIQEAIHTSKLLKELDYEIQVTQFTSEPSRPV